MFARVTIFKEPVDEGIRVTRDRVVPVVLGLSGSKGGFFLVNRKSGKTLSLTLWESEEALRASEAPIAKLRAERVVEIPGSETLVVDEYEVIFHPRLASREGSS